MSKRRDVNETLAILRVIREVAVIIVLVMVIALLLGIAIAI